MLIFATAVIVIAQLLYDSGIVKRREDVHDNYTNKHNNNKDVCKIPTTGNESINNKENYRIDSNRNHNRIDKVQLKTPREYKSGGRSKTEKKCCEIMNKLTGEVFFPVRPDFLKNELTGKNLELDCYNHRLRLAVEYNGIQHYKFPNYFHKSKEEFIQQVRRDDLKRRLCDEHGVYLIVVPYTKKDNLEQYLKQEYERYLQLK